MKIVYNRLGFGDFHIHKARYHHLYSVVKDYCIRTLYETILCAKTDGQLPSGTTEVDRYHSDMSLHCVLCFTLHVSESPFPFFIFAGFESNRDKVLYAIVLWKSISFFQAIKANFQQISTFFLNPTSKGF